jgi:nitrate/nitrite transport system substrate-binding protein
MEHKIEIFTDGSSLGNPGRGGYGVVIVGDDKIVHEIGGFEKNTTNNIMEMKAVIEACKWLDVMSNRKKAATWLTKPYYVNAPLAVIEVRLLGSSDLGCDLGVQRYKDDYMKFYNNGIVNMPKKSYGMWFLAQFVRFGMLKTEPSYKAIVEKLILDDLYAEVAKEMSIPVQPDMKPFKTQLDILFDPANIASYLKGTKK